MGEDSRASLLPQGGRSTRLCAHMTILKTEGSSTLCIPGATLVRYCDKANTLRLELVVVSRPT